MTGPLLAVLLAAGAAPPDAAEVLAAVQAADPWAYAGAEVRARAVVRDGAGGERTLRFVVRAARAGGGISARTTVVAPSDVAGVAFLLVARPGAEDERWLYLPALGKPRRIAGAARDGSFLGTHLSYADLDRGELRAAVARSVAADALDGVACWRVEAEVPGAAGPYGRVVAWARQGDLLPLRIDLHGRAGGLAKTLAARELKRIGGRWVATRSAVVDRARGGETEIVVEGWAPADPDPRELTPAALSGR